MLTLVGLRCVLAASVPLTPDEAYYTLWSHYLQAGYVDHPFMVAWWIRAGCFLMGEHAFGVRFAGVVASLVASLAFYDAARRFFPSMPVCALWAVWFLNATILSGLGMGVMTPDTPLLFFVVLMLWAVSRAYSTQCATLRTGWWCVVGLCLGLGGDSKYTMLFMAIGLAGYVLGSRERLWRQIGPWLAGGIALLCVMPVVCWNATHHWTGFFKQGERAGVWHPARAMQFLGELIGGQIGLMTPLVCVLCGWGLWKVRNNAPLLIWLVVPGVVVFAAHAVGDRVQANWPGVLYPPLLLAGAWLAGQKPSLARWAAGSAWGVVMLLGVQALWAPLPLSAHYDPVIRQSRGWHDFANAVQKQAQVVGADAVIVDDYALASVLAFQRTDVLPVIGRDRRWNFLDGLPEKESYHAVRLEEAREPGTGILLQRVWHGRVVRAYRLVPVGWSRGHGLSFRAQ